MTVRVLTWLVTCAVTCAVTRALYRLPRSLGELDLPQAAFVEVFSATVGDEDKVDRQTLYVSSFNPGNILGDDKVYYLKSPGSQLDNVANWKMQVLDHKADWTNDICYTPPEAVGFEGVVVTSGFLVPFKTHGKLQVFNTEVSPPAGPYLVTGMDVHDWAYHRAVWKDMDGDGDMDLVTARFNQNSITKKTTKSFAYLENNGSSPVDSGLWRQHEVISDGPDVGFRWITLSSGTKQYDVLLAGEFWNERIVIYWTEDGIWSDPSAIQSRVIDDTTGQVFDVFFDDLNRDGTKDVWASCFDLEHKNGSLYVWTVPEDFINGDWERHTIDTNFHPNSMLFGETMSPGSAVIFHPTRSHLDSSFKPFILLSGDDDGNHYILQPATEDPQDWTYERQTLVETGKTTAGQVTVADLDGDGEYTEIIAAGYTIGKVYVFTYAPQ